MTRLHRAAVAAVVAAGASLVAAVPAHAGTPAFDFTAPARGQVFTTEGFTFDVNVRMPTSDGRLVGDVTVNFTQVPGKPTPGPINRTPGSVQSYRITQPVSFPYNGQYEVKVTAGGRNNFLDGNTAPVTDGTTFTIDANPRVPTGVNASADSKTRVVTVAWAPNPEPDRVGYVVQKQGSGGGWSDFAATDKTSITDESTAKAGGTYNYRVRAVRHSARPNELNQSEPSAPRAAGVPPPPAPPPTTAPAGGEEGDGETDRGVSTDGAGGGEGGTPGDGGSGTEAGSEAGSGGTVTDAGRPGGPRLATSGKVDLSDFNSLLAKSGSRPGGGPGGELASGEDDGTYDETLPFGARRGGQEGDELGDEAAVGDDLGDEPAGNLQALGFLAGGLLATVLAMHVLWVRSEVHRAEQLDLLAPEGPPPVSAEDRFGLSERRPRRTRARAEQPGPAAAP